MQTIQELIKQSFKIDENGYVKVVGQNVTNGKQHSYTANKQLKPNFREPLGCKKRTERGL